MAVQPSHETPVERKLLTVNQAADTVSVSRKTMYRWILAGLVEWCRTPIGRIRVYADSLTRKPAEKDKARG